MNKPTHSAFADTAEEAIAAQDAVASQRILQTALYGAA